MIELPVFGIKVRTPDNPMLLSMPLSLPPLGDIVCDPDIYATCVKCGRQNCLYQCDGSLIGQVEEEEEVVDRIRGNGAIDAILSLILAHACAGIDIESPAYLEGIETAFDAIANSS